MNDYAKSIFFRIVLVFCILSIMPTSGVLHAQGKVREIVVPEGGVDASGFPSVSVKAIVSDDTRGRVTGLTGADFTLNEDGQEVPFSLSEVEVGIQVVFILDASLSARQAGATGYTRLEEGKQIIYNYTQDQMAEGVDQVAVLAPESGTAVRKVAPLADDPADFTTFKNTVHDGTYLYELPEGIAATPLNDMVSMALNMLAGGNSGTHRAVVVISDGIDELSDRAVADIVNTANQLNVPIYTVIFGPANNWGGQAESNMKRLSLDTYGEHFQLSSEGRAPDPIEGLINQVMEPLYDNLTSQRTQYLLTYDSQVSSPGVHEVALSAGGKSTKASMSISIKPPQVSITQPVAGTQITRSTDDPNVAVQDIEPRTQTVNFGVSWPDGFARQIAAVDLLVDGVAVLDTCTPPCDQIVWNIASLAAGSHSIRVRVRGQQGLEAESKEVSLTISITTPEPTPTPKPTLAPPAPAAPTPKPPPACEDQYTGFKRITECNQEVVALGALGISFAALLLAIVVVRRPPQVVSTVARKVKDATIPFFPVKAQPRPAAASREALATLEVLEGDDSHTQPIELVSENTRLGRDEELVQVVFANRGVSRLHARITAEPDRTGGQRFVLYDEGSTSGTYVNFKPVGINGQQLQDGDTIHVGPVRLQIKIKEAVLHDATVAMKPIIPSVEEAPAEDEFATAPYQAAVPQPSIDDTQPFISQESVAPDAAPAPDAGDEEDGLSTEPYVPMDFGDE